MTHINRYNQLRDYITVLINSTLLERPISAAVSTDETIVAKANNIRTILISAGEQIRSQAINSIDKWGKPDITNIMSIYTNRVDELYTQIINALNRVDVQQVIPVLNNTVHNEMDWLYKNIQILTLSIDDYDRQWSIWADDNCLMCSALSRVKLDDPKILIDVWKHDYCRSILVIDDDLETAQLTQVKTNNFMAIHVPVIWATAIRTFVTRCETMYMPILRKRVNIHYVTDFKNDEYMLLRKQEVVYAKWSTGNWREVIAHALINESILQKILRKVYDKRLSDGSLTADKLYTPATVIDPIAMGDINDYAHACGVMALVDILKLHSIDPLAYEVINEYLMNE